MTLVQEIKHDYMCGRITYDEMAHFVQTEQANCKHMATTIFPDKEFLYKEFCDKCGKEIEDEE